MLNYLSLLLFGFCLSSVVEGRKCFNCLNAGYSGLAYDLLGAEKCGDFTGKNTSIVANCPNTASCYTATLDETL